MKATFKLRKLACGIAFAASILTVSNAHAQKFRVAPPQVRAQPRSQPRPHYPQGSTDLLDPGIGGRALGTTAGPTFTSMPSNTAAPWYGPAAGGAGPPLGNYGQSTFPGNSVGGFGNQGANYQQPQQGFYPQGQQGFFQQPDQGFYQQPQQAFYQPGQQGYYQSGGGDRFQVPAGYASYPAGTAINYGGASYVIAGDGTIVSYAGAPQGSAVSQPAYTGPVSGQRYQVPSGYESYAAGTTINYGGASYVIAGDGTMTVYTAAQQAAVSTQPASSGPISGQRYQVPAEFATSAAGTSVTYGGHKYLINNDLTMTAISDNDPAATQNGQDPAKPTPGKRYQIPAEFANSAPGAVIAYGNYKYLANNDNTMTAFSDQGAQP
jgi:hypothetical protein